MASTFVCEFPACVQPNALQKRYSARSPVGLFALRVMPRVRSSSPSPAWRASSWGGVNSERSIRALLLQSRILPRQAVGRKLSDRQPLRVKQDAVLYAVAHISAERHTARGIIGGREKAPLIRRTQMPPRLRAGIAQPTHPPHTPRTVPKAGGRR